MPWTFPRPVERHNTRHHVYLSPERPPEKWASWECACGQKKVLKNPLVRVSEVTDLPLHEWRDADEVNTRCVDVALKRLNCGPDLLALDGMTVHVLRSLEANGCAHLVDLNQMGVHDIERKGETTRERAERIAAATPIYEDYHEEWEVLDDLGLLGEDARKDMERYDATRGGP